MDTAVVSKFVYDELQKMGDAGFNKEEKIEYLENLSKKGIISKAAKKEIQGLNQYGIYVDDIENAKDDNQRNIYILDSIRSMKENGIETKYVTTFLDKLYNDGFISPNSKPAIVNGIKEIFAK